MTNIVALYPENDGKFFINIYSRGSNLGSQLSNMFKYSFEYQGITFKSVEHAWHYFKLYPFDQDFAKSLLEVETPFQVKQLAKLKVSEEIKAYVMNAEFQDIIKQVIHARLNSDSKLKIMLRNSHLPFVHFYYYGDWFNNPKVYDETEKYRWLVDIFEDYRTDLWFEYLDGLLEEVGENCFDKRTAPSTATYVGRGSKINGVTLGNPFPVSLEIKNIKKTDRFLFDKEVARSVINFRSYFITQILDNPAQMRRVLKEVQNKPLQCFCNNGTTHRALGAGFCHSLIIASFAKNLDKICEVLSIPKE